MEPNAGSCHCGAVSVTYSSAKPLQVGECQCSFCRKHGARNVSDPGGMAEIISTVPLTRYRFGLGITDFLICPKCGCYVAAAMADGSGGWRSTLNLNCFDEPHLELAAEPMVYDGEDAGSRAARRLERWTPTQIREPEPPAATDA